MKKSIFHKILSCLLVFSLVWGSISTNLLALEVQNDMVEETLEDMQGESTRAEQEVKKETDTEEMQNEDATDLEADNLNDAGGETAQESVEIQSTEEVQSTEEIQNMEEAQQIVLNQEELAQENALMLEEDEEFQETEEETEEETVEVAKVDIITRFEERDLDADSLFFKERPSLEQILEKMPKTLKAYININGKEEAIDLPVTWFCVGEEYDNSSYYYYQFSPKWDEEKYKLDESIDLLTEAPYIPVFLREGTWEKDVDTIQAITLNQNQTVVYNYLRNILGLNLAATCGVLGNIDRESGFSPTAYNKNDSYGTQSYGICQWNNGSGAKNRYGQLISWCNNKGYNYTTLNAQLEFMKYELGSNSYFQYSTLKNNIANTVDGAVQAARIWAIYFEGCASSDYTTRENLAKQYWNHYSPNATKPTISPNGVPGTLTVGSKFSIGGTINSNVNISSVTVGVYDEAGNMKTGKTVSPNSTSYNIKNVDAAILFNNLSAGVYRYTIKATNSAGTSEYTKYFAVLSNKATISDGMYYIATSKNTAYGLSIDNSSNESGANVFLWDLGSGSYQKFNFKHIGNGYYEITSVGSGLSLDVAGGTAENRTNIQQYTKNNSDAQKWQVLPYNGTYYIIPKCATSQALDLYQANVANRTNIQTYQFNHNPNQRWTLIKATKNIDTAVITEEYNNHKYEVYDNSMSWVDAKAFCEKKGGNLVAINTEEENTFITNLIKKGSRNWYWLGASDAEAEGQWKWVTNENFAYSKWASGEPNGGTGENFAIIIAKEQYVGQWGDIIGNPRANSFYGVPHGGFICEYNLNRSIEKAEIKLSTEKYTYDGKEKTPEVTVILDNETLAKDTDYTVSYQNNTNIGTAKVIVTGKGNYAGTVEKTFTIEKAAEVVEHETKVSALNATASIGGEVKIPVSITKNPGIAGFSFDVKYDNTVLTLKSIEKAGLTSVGTFTTNDTIVNWYTDENISEDGELLLLVFEVAKDTKVDSTKVSVSPHDGKKNLVDQDGKYVEAQYGESEIKITNGMLGDVNEDGDITIGDVVLLNRYVLGKNANFSEQVKQLADVTGDGDITIGDVVRLNRFVLGKIQTLL